MAQPICSAQDTIVNRDKCYYNWPKYPCYSKKYKSCFSPDGTMLEDPFFHIYDGLARAYIWGFNTASETLADRSLPSDPIAEQKLREVLVSQGPWAPIMPIPGVHEPLENLETSIGLVHAAENIGLRYIPGNPVLGRLYADPINTLKGAATIIYNNTLGKCTRRRRRRRMSEPPRLERQGSEERGRGNKKTKKRRKRKRTRKNKKKHKKL